MLRYSGSAIWQAASLRSGELSSAHSSCPTALRECAAAPDEYEVWCHVGYVKNVIDVAAVPDGGFEYCSMVSDPNIKARCYDAVGHELWALENSPERREAACQMAEP